MNTNNVISLEHSVILHVENAIIDVLSNRAGKWVGEFVLYNAGDSVSTPNLNVGDVIREMTRDGTIEKSYQTVFDKFNQPINLPLYRLTPTFGS